MTVPGLPDLELTFEADLWTLKVPRLPLGVEGSDLDVATADLITGLRDYCDAWNDHLSTSANHSGNAGIVRALTWVSDDTLRVWISETVNQQLVWEIVSMNGTHNLLDLRLGRRMRIPAPGRPPQPDDGVWLRLVRVEPWPPVIGEVAVLFSDLTHYWQTSLVAECHMALAPTSHDDRTTDVNGVEL